MKASRGMQIFPVLDLMESRVVRGVAGQRERYRPVESVLTSGWDALDIAQAFQSQLGLSKFYLADLDAIRFSRPQQEILERITNAFPGCWLDGGIRISADVSRFPQSGEVVFVLGLETIVGPQVLSELCRDLGPERIAFSLDLKAGDPLGNLQNWRSALPLDIARQAVETGVRNLIVLDLAQVGMRDGVSTLPLCRSIKHEFPEVQVVTGGGIRNARDLRMLKDDLVDGALVASAFHNGGLRREDIAEILDSPTDDIARN